MRCDAMRLYIAIYWLCAPSSRCLLHMYTYKIHTQTTWFDMEVTNRDEQMVDADDQDKCKRSQLKLLFYYCPKMAVAGWLFTKIGYLKLVFFFVRQKTTAAAAATKYLIAYSKSFPFVWSLPIWVLLCCFHPFISIALAFLASYLCIFSKIFSMS